MNNIAFCILFFEKADQTIKCIESILSSKAIIYILNNGSSLESSQKIREFCKQYEQIKLFFSERNLGVGGGRNVLIKNSTEEWLFFIDNDIIVNRLDWFHNLCIEMSDSDEGLEVLIPRLFNKHEERWQKYRNILIIDGKLCFANNFSNDLNWFPGGASLVKRSVFQRLGHYDEDLFVGGEDIEFCLRGIFSGNPVHARLIDSVSVTHFHEKASTGDDSKFVKIRYELSTIKQSFAIIESKYEIQIPDDWLKWNLNQEKFMIHGMPILYNIKIKIRRFLEYILGLF